MRLLQTIPKVFFFTILSFWLTACGGGSDDEAEANTNCVLGSSNIGECETSEGTVTAAKLNNIKSDVNDHDTRIEELEDTPTTTTATTAPTVNDDINNGFLVGSKWVDTTQKAAYILINNVPGVAVWRML